MSHVFEELFYATYDRYYCQHGKPPFRMRANKGMRESYVEHLELTGCPMIKHPQVKDSSTGTEFLFTEFVFHGVIVRCDLEVEAPTLIA